MSNLTARCKTSKIKKQSDRVRTRNVRERFMQSVSNLKGDYIPVRTQCQSCGSMADPDYHVC